MRTSQYILFSFFGFIILAVLVLYIDSVDAAKDNMSELIEHRTKFPPKNLKSFSVIVAKPHSSIQIIKDSTNSISIGYMMEGKTYEFPKYEIVNDTLFISESVTPTESVIRCKSLHSIIGQNKSNISLNNFTADHLSIHLNGSRLNGGLNNQTIDSLELIINNGSRLSLSLNQSKIDFGKLKGSNSHIELYGSNNFHIIEVELENSSEFSVSGKRDKLIINSDTSSKYNIRNQQ